MLNLKHLTHVDNKINATYEVVSDGGDEFKMRLTQDLSVTICANTGVVQAELHMIELKAPSFDEAVAKMAVWCDRMAEALRAPRKVVTSAPIFAKDWEAVKEGVSTPLGLTWERLQAQMGAAGMTAEDIREGSDELHEHDYIKFPRIEVKYFPVSHKEDVPDILKTLELTFPGITGGGVIREDNPVFLDPFPYARGAIAPLSNTSRTAHDFFSLSEHARAIYRVIAQAYVDCICLPPAPTETA